MKIGAEAPLNGIVRAHQGADMQEVLDSMTKSAKRAVDFDYSLIAEKATKLSGSCTAIPAAKMRT